MSISFTPAQEDDDNSAGSPSGVGRYLRAARQSRGLKPEQIADQLRLNRALVEALERDDYKALPDRVFVTGYIRKYARLVGLDPEPLLDAYRATPRLGGARPVRRKREVSHLTLGLISLGILILLGVTTFLWQRSRQPGTETEAIGADEIVWETALATWPETAPGSQAPAPTTASDPTMVPETTPADGIGTSDPAARPPAEKTGGKETDSKGTGDEATGSGETDGKETVAKATGGDEATGDKEMAVVAARTIVVSFEGSCWTDIRDSEEKYRLVGMMKEGDRHILGGTPPYSVTLGNKKVVRITIDGVPVDLEPYSRSIVARFSLDPEPLP